MKTRAPLVLAPLILVMALAAPAHAACYADYKAKQDGPLRLHYGVAQVPSCDKANAAEALRPRLASAGWTLLTILSTFDDSKLGEKRAKAGEYFLRY